MSIVPSELLRSLQSLSGPFPSWDMEYLPDRPGKLFLDWLRVAIDSDVKEPHAMTISTVDQDGHPDARVLILKNVVDDSFYFASSAESRKGQQLKDNPHVALTFYWPALGRQIRIKGTAEDMGDEAGADDFRKRSAGARAVAMTGHQSQELGSEEVLDSSIEAQMERIQRDPDVVSPQWRLYAVNAEEVEFWQGDPERKHTRIRYQLRDGQWKQHRLWP
ncbi:pyridoxine/pyridoxamine 5'-phosphate oxidase [Paenibacillus xylanilyticus]|uniref:Pyridoxamine 5'-phosphate oxidase n=1 Tax=Paenibacillus xylanilyticus TaxID=248903 RepID=A0A7Y6C3B5_9BACL|nr:pyridoxal 5'-phosphate synthase [Paenibacillus xylanilyticus]NUU79814.1 pyridoxamine 5'-phosphate oxidase [Paenibacillus xylanilyticus]